MDKNLRITMLAGEAALSGDLLSEHGLSFRTEYGDKQILFDTGQSHHYKHVFNFFSGQMLFLLCGYSVRL